MLYLYVTASVIIMLFILKYSFFKHNTYITIGDIILVIFTILLSPILSVPISIIFLWEKYKIGDIKIWKMKQ